MHLPTRFLLATLALGQSSFADPFLFPKDSEGIVITDSLSTTEKSHVLWKTSLPDGGEFRIYHPKTIDLRNASVTTNAGSAVFCGPENYEFKHAKIYMPEHGHGASGLQFIKLQKNCLLFSDLNFTMPGLWQFRITLEDRDSGESFVIAIAGQVLKPQE